MVEKFKPSADEIKHAANLLRDSKAVKPAAVLKDRNVNRLLKDGSKDLGLVDKMRFAAGKSKVLGFMGRHKVLTFLGAAAAAGGAMLVLRHGNDEVPPQEDLTPTAAAISSPEQLTGPADGMAADKWQQTVAAGRGAGAQAR